MHLGAHNAARDSAQSFGTRSRGRTPGMCRSQRGDDDNAKGVAMPSYRYHTYISEVSTVWCDLQMQRKIHIEPTQRL